MEFLKEGNATPDHVIILFLAHCLYRVEYYTAHSANHLFLIGIFMNTPIQKTQEQPRVQSEFKPRYFCIADKKMAYLSIPKNACSTLKFALASRGDETKRAELKDASKLHTEPSNYFDEVIDVSAGINESYFTFTFVRNPFSRFFSFYRNKIQLDWDPNMHNYMERQGFEPQMPIKDCLLIIQAMDTLQMNEHFAPQSAFVYSNNDSNVKFIGHLERLAEDVKTVEKRAGFTFLLPKLNVSKGKFPIEADDESLDLIRNIYATDFKAFNYSLDSVEF
jgi:hypothetical protein